MSIRSNVFMLAAGAAIATVLTSFRRSYAFVQKPLAEMSSAELLKLAELQTAAGHTGSAEFTLRYLTAEFPNSPEVKFLQN